MEKTSTKKMAALSKGYVSLSIVPESSRQTLASPIFRSPEKPSLADCFRKCIGDKSATLLYTPEVQHGT